MQAIPRPLEAVLFDLDGTLVDSIDDLATGVNLTLEGLGLPVHSREAVASFVGDGVVSLLARSIAAATGRDPWTEPAEKRAQAMLPEFRAHYNDHLVDQTVLLPGARELIAGLPPRIGVGLVTNKPEEPARRILRALGIGDRFAAVLGGDSMPTRKPEPEMVDAALALCGASRSRAILVGDGMTDARAGRAAGVVTVGVPSGLGCGLRSIRGEVDIFVPDLHALRELLRGH